LGWQLGCGYCWPQGWFHPSGVGMLAKCRVVLGTRPPLAMFNVVITAKKKIEKRLTVLGRGGVA